MKKSKLLNTSIIDNTGLRVSPNVVIGEAAGYASGDILDANATNKFINDLQEEIIGIKSVLGIDREDLSNFIDTYDEIKDFFKNSLSLVGDLEDIRTHVAHTIVDNDVAPLHLIGALQFDRENSSSYLNASVIKIEDTDAISTRWNNTGNAHERVVILGDSSCPTEIHSNGHAQIALGDSGDLYTIWDSGNFDPLQSKLEILGELLPITDLLFVEEQSSDLVAQSMNYFLAGPFTYTSRTHRWEIEVYVPSSSTVKKRLYYIVFPNGGTVTVNGSTNNISYILVVTSVLPPAAPTGWTTSRTATVYGDSDLLSQRFEVDGNSLTYNNTFTLENNACIWYEFDPDANEGWSILSGDLGGLSDIRTKLIWTHDDFDELPLPASLSPLSPSASAAIGTSLKYAREDHRHPKDSTKANLASPTFTGTPSAPTATAGTNTTQIATTAFVKTAVSQIEQSVSQIEQSVPKLIKSSCLEIAFEYSTYDYLVGWNLITNQFTLMHSDSLIVTDSMRIADLVYFENGGTLYYESKSVWSGVDTLGTNTYYRSGIFITDSTMPSSSSITLSSNSIVIFPDAGKTLTGFVNVPAGYYVWSFGDYNRIWDVDRQIEVYRKSEIDVTLDQLISALTYIANSYHLDSSLQITKQWDSILGGYAIIPTIDSSDPGSGADGD